MSSSDCAHDITDDCCIPVLTANSVCVHHNGDICYFEMCCHFTVSFYFYETNICDLLTLKYMYNVAKSLADSENHFVSVLFQLWGEQRTSI